MRRCFGVVICVIGLLSASQALAQSTTSLGEQGQALACVYACQTDTNASGKEFWREITTLVLTNHRPWATPVTLVLYDGKQKLLAVSTTELGGNDLDEVQVCGTLEAAGIMAPSSGLLEVMVGNPLSARPTPSDGVYGWTKSLLGKFRKQQPEPFDGKVSSVARTECRVLPPGVATAESIFLKIAAQQPREVPPLLLEETADTGRAKACNGFAGIVCSPDEICDLVDPTCSTSDAEGVCVPKGDACIQIYAPVCGCDGVTYSNDCERLVAGAVLAHQGPCLRQGTHSGGAK